MTLHKPRPTHAQLIARCRAFERADVLALIDEMIAGVPELAAKYQAAGRDGAADFDFHAQRLRALHGTIAAGCHEREGTD